MSAVDVVGVSECGCTEVFWLVGDRFAYPLGSIGHYQAPKAGHWQWAWLHRALGRREIGRGEGGVCGVVYGVLAVLFFLLVGLWSRSWSRFTDRLAPAPTPNSMSNQILQNLKILCVGEFFWLTPSL